MKPPTRIACFTLILLLPLLSCHLSSDEDRLHAFIATHVEQIEPLLKSENLAAWNANATGEKKYYDELATLDFQLRTIWSNSTDFAFLKELKEKQSVRDPMLQRQLIILFNSFAPNQADTALLRAMTDKQSTVAMAFNTARGVLGGVAMSDNELMRILSSERDQDRRRAAWEALKQVGNKVAPMVIDLVKVRNQIARALGYENYYVMMLDMDEQDPVEVLKIFDELAELTEAPFLAMKRALDVQRANVFAISPARLRPWHYEDPFFQEAPPSEESIWIASSKGKVLNWWVGNSTTAWIFRWRTFSVAAILPLVPESTSSHIPRTLIGSAMSASCAACQTTSTGSARFCTSSDMVCISGISTDLSRFFFAVQRIRS